METEEKDGPSFHQRLAGLEATCARQEAQIDGLVSVLSDLLAAHVVLHNDTRLCVLLREYGDGDLVKKSSGGTTRLPASFFAARGDLWFKVLARLAASPVFDRYRRWSVFSSKEDRQLRKLQRIRDEILRMGSP